MPRSAARVRPCSTLVDGMSPVYFRLTCFPTSSLPVSPMLNRLPATNRCDPARHVPPATSKHILRRCAMQSYVHARFLHPRTSARRAREAGRTWLLWAVLLPLRDLRAISRRRHLVRECTILPGIRYDTAHVELRDSDVLRVLGKRSSGETPPGLVPIL